MKGKVTLEKIGMKFTKPTFASITADFTKKVTQLSELIDAGFQEVDAADIAIKEANDRKAAATAEVARAQALKEKIVNLLD